MDILEGLPIGDGNSAEHPRNIQTELVCRLQQSLYGLKQSPRMWNCKIDDFLVLKQGFKRLKADQSIYIRRSPSSLEIIVLYVDDLLILTGTSESMQLLKSELNNSFEMTDCGLVYYFLGIRIECEQGCRGVLIS